MRVASGSVQPDTVELMKKEMGKAHLKLRDNIREKTREDVEGDMSTYYEWDEIEVTLPTRADIVDYAQKNFINLWDGSSPMGVRKIDISADKTTINADGVDVATITAVIPVDSEYCFITVNGPPAEKADVVDGQVTREFSAAEAGLYKIEFFAGNKTASMIVEVIENA